eukprot:361264-Chlamydomonas_euryale.AAC.1
MASVLGVGGCWCGRTGKSRPPASVYWVGWRACWVWGKSKMHDRRRACQQPWCAGAPVGEVAVCAGVWGNRWAGRISEQTNRSRRACAAVGRVVRALGVARVWQDVKGAMCGSPE